MTPELLLFTHRILIQNKKKTNEDNAKVVRDVVTTVAETSDTDKSMTTFLGSSGFFF